MSQPVHNRTYFKDRRKELRNSLTPAEATLWTILKNGGLKDRKFRRQHSIENYIVDFYCPAERLIVELDGVVHNDPIQWVHDEERSKRLMELGNRVLRFENRLVFEDPIAVMDEIERNFGWQVSGRLWVRCAFTTPAVKNGFAFLTASPPKKGGELPHFLPLSRIQVF